CLYVHYLLFVSLVSRRRHTPQSTLFPYTTLFRSCWTTCFGPSYKPSLIIISISPAFNVVRIVSNSTCSMIPIGKLFPVSWITSRSEEHTSELQSRFDLVCRLLLEKKKK